MSSALPRLLDEHGRPRVPQRFHLPQPDPEVTSAHTAMRGAAMALIRVGQHFDARELLLATVKSALRSWCRAVGYHDVARSTNVLYYARLLRDVQQIDRPTYMGIRKLAQGLFDGNSAADHLLTVREIHEAVYWAVDEMEGGAE